MFGRNLAATICCLAAAGAASADGVKFWDLCLNNAAAYDGSHPRAGLVWDGGSYLYGVTMNGGASGGGTLFRYKPSAYPDTSTTTFKRLHSFVANDHPTGTPILVNVSGTTYLRDIARGRHKQCRLHVAMQDGRHLVREDAQLRIKRRQFQLHALRWARSRSAERPYQHVVGHVLSGW